MYFAASENHLLKETGSVRLASIQARLAQCFYLLSESRVNHCWSLFGTTGRLALAIGLHRRWRRESISDNIESECRKRVFWCAYSLDIYLSAALGRPKIFHDEDIDQVSFGMHLLHNYLLTCIQGSTSLCKRSPDYNRFYSATILPWSERNASTYISRKVRNPTYFLSIDLTDRLLGS